MERITIAFTPEQIEKIDEKAELLNLTRPEYLGKLFAWGGWVADESQIGRRIISVNEDHLDQCEVLSSTKLVELRESWAQVISLSVKK